MGYVEHYIGLWPTVLILTAVLTVVAFKFMKIF